VILGVSECMYIPTWKEKLPHSQQLSPGSPPLEYTKADGITSCDLACHWDVDVLRQENIGMFMSLDGYGCFGIGTAI
jgi:hypothetical protein